MGRTIAGNAAPLDALILAAGLGTRLGAVGREIPKALLEIGGRTMLERIVERVVAAGAERIVVNVHHHADRIQEWVESHDLGVEILLSHEPDHPLETGGGLLQARRLFRPGASILLHNVDVLCDAELGALRAAHEESNALATLAVSDRVTSRRLLFDEVGLCGRVDARASGGEVDARATGAPAHAPGGRVEVRPPRGATREWAFSGIHVVSPEFPSRITEQGVFSILEVYLRLASAGARILPHSIQGSAWYEVGTPERLEVARKVFAG